MINDSLSKNDAAGIASVLDDETHRVLWLFRDNDGDWIFVNYPIWYDVVETEFAGLCRAVFERSGREGEIISAHLTLLVRAGNEFVRPERPNDSKVLVYVVDDSDGRVVVDGTELSYSAGSFYDVSENQGYGFIKPRAYNFVRTIEIEYR